MKVKKPKLTLVTPENIDSMPSNPQSKRGVAKGDEEYEEFKEALRELFIQRLNIDSEDIK